MARWSGDPLVNYRDPKARAQRVVQRILGSLNALNSPWIHDYVSWTEQAIKDAIHEAAIKPKECHPGDCGNSTHWNALECRFCLGFWPKDGPEQHRAGCQATGSGQGGRLQGAAEPAKTEPGAEPYV